MTKFQDLVGGVSDSRGEHAQHSRYFPMPDCSICYPALDNDEED